MKGIRQAVTCLCFAMTLSAPVPVLAESGGPSQAADSGSAPPVHAATKLDLPQLRSLATWNDPTGASPRASIPMNVQTQESGGGWSGLSAAKKTWIIVGIVVGAAVGVAAVSHHGDSKGGGGGY